jgi:hypothetical protein
LLCPPDVILLFDDETKVVFVIMLRPSSTKVAEDEAVALSRSSFTGFVAIADIYAAWWPLGFWLVVLESS